MNTTRSTPVGTRPLGIDEMTAAIDKAAEQLGRRCFAMEIEPRYCDVAVKRWELCTGKQASREPRK